MQTQATEELKRFATQAGFTIGVTLAASVMAIALAIASLAGL